MKKYFEAIWLTWFGSSNSIFAWLFFMLPVALGLFREISVWTVGFVVLMFLTLPAALMLHAYMDGDG